MRKYLLAVALSVGAVSLVLACSGNTPHNNPDAKVFKDAAAGTFGAPCTTVSNMSTECNSKVCTNAFNQLPTPVCSVQCTMLGMNDPSECPVGSDGQAFCNMKGYCKP